MANNPASDFNDDKYQRDAQRECQPPDGGTMCQMRRRVYSWAIGQDCPIITHRREIKYFLDVSARYFGSNRNLL